MVKVMKQMSLWICVLLMCVCILSPLSLAAETVVARIPMSLTLEGPLSEDPEVFKFELAAKEESCPLPVGSENGVYIQEVVGTSALVIPIDCDRLGVFSYTLRQLPGENENCTYDEQVYNITIYVTIDEDHVWHTNVAVYEDGNTTEKTEITFRNVYAEHAEVSIAALKTMDGETPENGAFTFQLKDESGAVLEEVQNVGKDVRFSAISYDKAGTYKYTISEVPGTEEDIVYDAIVYEAIVEVTRDEKRDYQAKLTYSKDGEPLEDLPLFRNESVPQEIPKTGDDNSVYLYLILMLFSAVAISALVLAARKNKNAA